MFFFTVSSHGATAFTGRSISVPPISARSTAVFKCGSEAANSENTDASHASPAGRPAAQTISSVADSASNPNEEYRLRLLF